MHQLRLFLIALQFFTRIPIPAWVGFEPHWLHQASRYFPAVGIVVGAVGAGMYAASAMLFTPVVAALLSTIATVYLTGAFHEDGFADTCDGLGGGMTTERVLVIMKDSRIGAYGAIGIGLMLALKCAALAGLPSIATAAGALLLGHPLSRLASTSLIWTLDYVRDEGKAKPLAETITNGEFAVALLSALLAAAVIGLTGLLSWKAIGIAAAAAGLCAWWLARKFVRRIGGYTGDCLGAVQQVSEVAIYLSVLAVMRT
jgi:adenosylcobinamide-GDP ribazoletransferase